MAVTCCCALCPGTKLLVKLDPASPGCKATPLQPTHCLLPCLPLSSSRASPPGTQPPLGCALCWERYLLYPQLKVDNQLPAASFSFLGGSGKRMLRAGPEPPDLHTARTLGVVSLSVSNTWVGATPTHLCLPLACSTGTWPTRKGSARPAPLVLRFQASSCNSPGGGGRGTEHPPLLTTTETMPQWSHKLGRLERTVTGASSQFLTTMQKLGLDNQAQLKALCHTQVAHAGISPGLAPWQLQSPGCRGVCIPSSPEVTAHSQG